MRATRPLGMATIAAAMVVVAFVVVATSASADELSDLRANSDLLQRRLDQLERAPPGTTDLGSANAPESPAAGGGSFPRSFLVPGTETSVRVGGTVSETLRYRPQ